MELKSYKADLHIHTVLSPCGDLDMSPKNIIQRAKELGLDMIAISDHNTTRQVRVTQKLGAENGILVLGAVEMTTQEEAHVLAFFETAQQLEAFQQFLDEQLPPILNDEERFGYQLIVNEEEEIIGEEPYLLINAIKADLDSLYERVHSLGGIFIPAHVNKPSTSLMSQLGFIPPDLKADGLEITKFITKDAFLKKFAYLKRFPFIKSSDAHFLHTIGEAYTVFHMYDLTFEEFRKTLRSEEGRFIDGV